MTSPSTSPSTRHVFVYGTLRRHDVRDINRLSPAPLFVDGASVAGTMYHLGGYPGIVLGGAGTVTGEVYAVEAELERVLDEIEEVWPQQTGEYRKRELLVELDGGGRIACFVYEIAPERTAGRPLIAGGDWMRRDRA